MKLNIKPKVTLVGAGPGDPDLITVKGVKALKNAKVVLYDALINRELLEYVPKEAKRIFVGKRKGMHSFTQDEINELIVTYNELQTAKLYKLYITTLFKFLELLKYLHFFSFLCKHSGEAKHVKR